MAIITDKKVAKYLKSCGSLANATNVPDFDIFPSQFKRGITTLQWKNNPAPAACNQYQYIFAKYNIIPQYCFSCYKLSIKPRNVVELIKLQMVFDALKLPDNNSRKCFIELRSHVKGHYSGLIYFQSLEDAAKSLGYIKDRLSQKISKDLDVTIKRGCTEYSQKYPEYNDFHLEESNLMPQSEKWFEIESELDRKHALPNFNAEVVDEFPNEMTPNHCLTIYNWLRYAETIGDYSYRTITKVKPAVFKKLDRQKFDNKKK